LNKKFRAVQKILDREITQVTNSTSELSQNVTRSPETTSVSTVSGLLGNIEHKLLSLKRKAEESLEEEMESTRLCKVRLDHLKEYVSGEMSESLSAAIDLVKGHHTATLSPQVSRWKVQRTHGRRRG
jgi:macrophage erythroblast attacher